MCMMFVDSAWAKKIDGDALLDPSRVIEVRIELPRQDWDRLRRQSRNPATAFSGLPAESPYKYFKADLWIDGEKIKSVGVRKKGFFGSADTERPSLKVKFDEYEKQDPIKGLSRLTLNNNKQDGSQVSQFLAYNLYRAAGNPAPRSNWAHVIVNGVSLGVYSHVESIKKPFLKRNFKDKSGNLYEGTLTDFHPRALDNIEVKTNKKQNDLGDVKRLTELLAAKGDLDLDELGKVIDVDSFYRHWALEAMIGFWDGYSSNQNNYYLYFNPTDGRGVFIPWGADFAFTSRGPFSFGNNGRSSVIYAQSILSHRLYRTPSGPERYRAAMRKLLDEVWDESKMLAEIDRAEKLVTPHLHSSQSGAARAMDDVREFIRGRRETLQRGLDQWRPSIPREPREPAHLVDVGKLSGTFATTFRASEAAGETNFSMQLDGKTIELRQVTVRVQTARVPSFGRGFGRPGGFGRPPGQPPQNEESQSPISIAINGNREGGQPITITLTIDREDFAEATADAVRVTGSFREGSGGRPGGGFGGFGGFGGGANRHVIGELQLTKSGTDAGDAVAGRVDLRIAETRGGFFQQRGGGGRGRQTFSPPASLAVQRALDADGNGTISASEIEKAAAALKRLDRNDDGEVSAEELQAPSRSAR